MSGPLRIGRLRKRSEFLAVAAAGRKVAAPSLVLQVRRCEPDCTHADAPADAWAGFTVTRRVGTAVVRNRARRRLRAAAADVLPRLGVARHEYVLIGREGTLNRAFPALIADLEGALRRAGHANIKDTAAVAPVGVGPHMGPQR